MRRLESAVLWSTLVLQCALGSPARPEDCEPNTRWVSRQAGEAVSYSAVPAPLRENAATAFRLFHGGMGADSLPKKVDIPRAWRYKASGSKDGGLYLLEMRWPGEKVDRDQGLFSEICARSECGVLTEVTSQFDYMPNVSIFVENSPRSWPNVVVFRDYASKGMKGRDDVWLYRWNAATKLYEIDCHLASIEVRDASAEPVDFSPATALGAAASHALSKVAGGSQDSVLRVGPRRLEIEGSYGLFILEVEERGDRATAILGLMNSEAETFELQKKGIVWLVQR